MTPEVFRKQVDVSRETLTRLEALADCLVQWRRRFNLMGERDLSDLWRRHMLDSAQLVPHIPADARIITDLGSGAGFPGLVLAVITGIETHLIESHGRKAAFLRAAARAAGAPAVVHGARIESLAPWPSDVVTARAVAPLDRLLPLARPFLEASGERRPLGLFLKGAKWEHEVAAARKRWTMDIEAVTSVTDPSGRVLKLRNIALSGPEGV